MFRAIILIFLINVITVRSQNLNFLNDNYYTWPDQVKVFEAIPDSLKQDDAVILKDDIELNFPGRFIKRRQSVKILNEQGLNYLSSVTLPQNFDITRLNNPLHKQGRFCNRFIPFIHDYKITYFAARIIRNKTIIELPVSVATNKLYWTNFNGERVPDYEFIFSFENLQVNDVIEYSYKAEIDAIYGTEQFYVNDYFFKLKTNLKITVAAAPEMKGLNILYNHNIDSAIHTRHDVPTGTLIYQNHLYKFKELNAIKYSQNILAGKYLPHVSANGYSVKKNYFDRTIQRSSFVYSEKYSWFIIPDSLYFKEKIYNKSGGCLRKFIAGFPDITSDSSKTQFFSQITDTLNAFKYLSAEQMHYGTSDQYSVNSSERLLKRQLVEEFIDDIYNDILFEKNIFYYSANVQDRRFGYHTTGQRSHDSYEAEFLALPVNKSFKFFLPRYNNLKYFPDELPFYYEGAYCALIPKNTNATKYNSDLRNIKFIKTPMSTYNENVRTENAVFKVNIDSLVIHATIKENLNGQFSTILRPFYNNESIDSTINTSYFKKCTEKPKTSEQKIKLTSSSKIFPFRTSYSCSETIALIKDSIELLNWFSFILTKKDFTQKITQNYFFDFTFTDTYNFLFEFNKPVTIKNSAEFEKSLTNEFFEINSTLVKQDDAKYLLSVTTKVKQYMLPEKGSKYLLEFVNILNDINTLKLNYTH